MATLKAGYHREELAEKSRAMGLVYPGKTAKPLDMSEVLVKTQLHIQ